MGATRERPHITRASLRQRIARLDWPGIERALDERGYATTPRLLSREECDALVHLYGDERRFRTRIDMARYRFGDGEYKYFATPLPPLVVALRDEVYRRLAPVATSPMRPCFSVHICRMRLVSRYG